MLSNDITEILNIVLSLVCDSGNFVWIMNMEKQDVLFHVLIKHKMKAQREERLDGSDYPKIDCLHSEVWETTCSLLHFFSWEDENNISLQILNQ